MQTHGDYGTAAEARKDSEALDRLYAEYFTPPAIQQQRPSVAAAWKDRITARLAQVG